MISDALELLGLACVVIAAFLVTVPLGVLVLGLVLLLIGTAVSADEPAPSAD